MKNKVVMVTVKNPFDLSSKKTDIIDFVEDKTIGAYVAELPDYDKDLKSVICHNGKLIEKNKLDVIVLRPGDCVIYAPAIMGGGDDGGKNVLGIIAGIALSVVSMGVGNLIATGTWAGTAAGMSAWGFGAYLGAAATMYLGGRLLSHMTPAPAIDVPDFETRSKYSWNTPQALSGQGYALPIVYGRYAPTPIILGQHVSTDGEKEYLNLLLCLGDGPVDALHTIKIADNPVANYNDVQVDYRLGTNDQTVIPGFSDTYSDQMLNYELTPESGYATQLMDTNAATGIEATLSLPAGLYYANDQGGLSSATVKAQIEYRLNGTSTWFPLYHGQTVSAPASNYISNVQAKTNARQETWTVNTTIEKKLYYPGNPYVFYYRLTISTSGSVSGAQADVSYDYKANQGGVFSNQGGVFSYANDYISFSLNPAILAVGTYTYTFSIVANAEIEITAANNTALKRVFSWPVAAGKYEVRVKCTYKSGTSSRYSTRLYWTQLTGVIPDDFTRPGKVLLAIKALATGQLSGGIPTISCIVERNIIWAWNPNTVAYEQKPANNPAWVAYDLIHRCKYLKDIRDGLYKYTVFGAPADRIIYQDFEDWATFCEEYDLQFDGIFDKTVELRTALKDPENCGRGKVLTFGTKFGAICDKPVDYVRSVYNMGNIKKGSFRLDYLDITERANAINVSYNDINLNYGQNIIPIFSDDYNNNDVIKNPTQIMIPGITRSSQAYREGKYRLRLAKYPVRTCAFEVNIEAVKDRVGDVIEVQHDVPQWGFGGRIAAVDGNTMTLDEPVELNPNTNYSIMVRHGDDSHETRAVVGVTEYTQTKTITVTTAFDTAPEQFDLYCFGVENTLSKPFRIVNITRSTKQDRLITAIEYIPEIYVEATDIPNIAYSTLTAETEVTAVSYGQETYMQKDGTIQSAIYVSWELPRGKYADRFIVYISSDNGANWSRFGETKAYKITITNVKALQYYKVKVVTVNDIGVVSAGFVSEQIYITGKDTPPANVTGLTATPFVVDTSKITLSWAKNTDPDIRGYVIIRTIAGVETDISQIITDNNYVYQAPNAGEVTLGVKAVDNSGNRSETAASTSVTFSNISDVVGFVVVLDSNNKTKVTLQWSANSEKDLSYYEIRSGGTSWNDAAVIVSKLKTTYFNYQLPSAGAYTFRIKAFNLGGFESTNAVNASGTFSFNPANVSNFAAVQSNLDKSKVRLTWDPVSDTDLDHYELRVGGSSWADAATLQSNITTTYFDTLISSETAYIYRIAAVNKAGYLSASPSPLSVSFNMKPATVSSITVTTRSDDRTTADIIWAEVADADLLEYELRYGGTAWENSTLLVKTKERSYVWKLSASGAYTIRVKAKNASGFYSSETTKNYTATVEPSNITGFVAMQNGENILLAWDKCTDADLAYYQIHEGSTYDNGTLLTTGLTVNTFEFLATTETTRAFHVKAFNRAGNKSITAASSSITIGNLLPKNIIETYNEMVLQSGTAVDVEFGTSNIRFSTLGGKFSDWSTTKFSDVGGETVLKLSNGKTSGSYTTIVKDMGEIISANIAVEYIPSVLITGGTSALTYSTSIDNVTWSDYKPYIAVKTVFRYIKFKIELAGVSTSPEINTFKIYIDVPDVIKSGSSTVTAGGSTVNYGYTFLSSPAVVATATESGKRAEVTGTPGVANFSVKVYNVSGTDVGGNINWIVKGY